MAGGALATPPMADYGIDVPERSRANQVIQSRLLAEPQYQAVLKLVEKYLPKFDVTNMVCAMHMCALTARDHEMLKRQIQFDPAFVTLFHNLKGQVLGHVHELSTRTTADLLWSCARLDIFDSELVNEVVADASSRLEMYSATGIGLLVFALGYVGQRPRAVFMQALVRELRSRIEKEFDQRSVSMVVYGMMRLGIRDDRLMKIVDEYLLRTGIDRSEPLSMVSLTFAYAKLEYWNANVFAAMSRSLIDGLKDLPPGLMIMTALSFARSSGSLKESHFMMEEIMRTTENRLQAFDNRALATMSFAAGKFDQLKEDLETYATSTGIGGMSLKSENSFAVEVVNEVQRRKYESFTMSEMSLIHYSLMRMKHRDEKFLQEIAKQFTENAAELTVVEIVNALYAFGKLEFIHIQFVHAMVTEVKRRGLLDEMDGHQISMLTYSLALSRVYDEEIMDKAALYGCQKVHEMECQSISMLMWSMAVLNATNHAEPLTSAVMEEASLRLTQFSAVGLSVVLWSAANLCGATPGIWALKILFTPGFWSQLSEDRHYTMMYPMFAALKAEAGMSGEDLEGWYLCRRMYEEVTGEKMGIQNRRLAERLAVQKIGHRANCMVPALEGLREAGVRADIVIEKLQLIIEVEGPQRMTIPLDKTMAEIGDEEMFGAPDDVVGQVRTAVECGLTGSAAFKRRLLRKCGWRVVTVSFDENEEYIADALGTMDKKDGDKAGDEAAAEMQEQEAFSAAAMGSVGEEITYTDEFVTTQEVQRTEYEERVRTLHAEALAELRRRILEERGNAAATGAYANHLEYRRWQVRLEKEVFKKMLAAI